MFSKVRVSSTEEQREFYDKILDADMSNLLMSALINDIGHINELEFDGYYRTKTYLNAPEPVQELQSSLNNNIKNIIIK